MPNHVKQIVALNLKATRFAGVYSQIEEKVTIRKEMEDKYKQLDKKVETFRKKSTEGGE